MPTESFSPPSFQVSSFAFVKLATGAEPVGDAVDSVVGMDGKASLIMQSSRALLGFVLTALIFCGCASVSPRPEKADTDRVCVYTRLINAYSALDAQHVLVRARGGRYYLFTVDRPYSGLPFARAIAVADLTSRVCNDGFGSLSFHDPAAGSTRCRIVKIEPVKGEDEARALISG